MERLTTGWVAAAAVALAVIGFTAPAWSGGERARIQVRDGPVITGDIVAFEGDAYTIDSPGLGRVRVPAGAVAKIEEAGRAPRRRASAHERGDPTRATEPPALDIGSLEEPGQDGAEWVERALSIPPFPASIDVDAESPEPIALDPME